MTTTFHSCDVDKNTDRCKTVTHREVFEKLARSKLEALAAPDQPVLGSRGFHALIETVHMCFAQHRPLQLKPDNIWITIAQGFATHINQNAEKYRGKFVKHEGKEEICILRTDFAHGSPDNDWPSCFGQFSDEIKSRIGDENHALLISDFSTTGPVARTVSEVVLMDVVQSYFTFVVWTECGIPEITLDGTVEDWQRLRAKAEQLKSFGDLDWWIDQLLPILDQFVAASSGKVDGDFWKSIYKTESGSGTMSVDGWIVKLLPYIKAGDAMERNPVLTSEGEWLETSSLPASISTVPFLFDTEPYQFLGGHTGIVQEDNGALRPVLGWAVRPAPAGTR